MKNIFRGLALIAIAGCSSGPSVYQLHIAEAKKAGIPLVIWAAKPSSPNSAGGIDVQIDFTNLSKTETIKYLNFTVKAYNSVGDPVGGEIRSSSNRNLQATGPYRPGTYKDLFWGTQYYNWSIKCVRVTKATIRYMSGKTKSYSGSNLKKLMGPGNNNSCKV